jgi:hypothetical protein
MPQNFAHSQGSAEQDEKRTVFAGLAMQAGLTALLKTERTGILTDAEIQKRHLDVCMAAWRSADLMLETEQAGHAKRNEFLTALESVMQYAEAKRDSEKARAASALDDAQMSDEPGITARAAAFAADRNREAARINQQLNTIRDYLNL